jgi:hypothetical protein
VWYNTGEQAVPSSTVGYVGESPEEGMADLEAGAAFHMPENDPQPGIELIWEELVFGPPLGRGVKTTLRRYDVETLKQTATHIAKMQPSIDKALTALGLPALARGKRYWADRVLPAIQKEIDRRENPTPRTAWNKPDLLATVLKVVLLRQRGKLHWGQCPFHNDTDASFQVNTERQQWRCWGACGNHGDSLDFIRRVRKQHGRRIS